MDSLSRIDAMSGSLLAEESLDRVYMDDPLLFSWFFNHAVIHSIILVTLDSSCSMPSLLNSTKISKGYDERASSRTTCINFGHVVLLNFFFFFFFSIGNLQDNRLS